MKAAYTHRCAQVHNAMRRYTTELQASTLTSGLSLMNFFQAPDMNTTMHSCVSTHLPCMNSSSKAYSIHKHASIYINILLIPKEKQSNLMSSVLKLKYKYAQIPRNHYQHVMRHKCFILCLITASFAFMSANISDPKHFR